MISLSFEFNGRQLVARIDMPVGHFFISIWEGSERVNEFEVRLTDEEMATEDRVRGALQRVADEICTGHQPIKPPKSPSGDAS